MARPDPDNPYVPKPHRAILKASRSPRARVTASLSPEAVLATLECADERDVLAGTALLTDSEATIRAAAAEECDLLYRPPFYLPRRPAWTRDSGNRWTAPDNPCFLNNWKQPMATATATATGVIGYP